jgi:hypothetical protein
MIFFFLGLQIYEIMVGMKRKVLLAIIAVLSTSVALFAQSEGKKGKTYNEKGEIVKKGWNFGPLPVVGYDADLGFQYGICCDFFNYGDGSLYPKYNYKMNVEASTYTKGSSVLRFYGDFPYLIKNTKLFVDATYFTAKKYEFFGFNGYQSNAGTGFYWPNQTGASFGPEPLPSDLKSAYNFLNRRQFRLICSMQRPFFSVKNLYWTAGLAYYNTKVGRVQIEEYQNQLTQYELLQDFYGFGVIRENEATGGNTTQLRLGMVYDIRDHNSDPTSGLYVEATLAGAPDVIDRNGYSNLSFTFLWQHYIPTYEDKLTFCYRIGTQNLLKGEMPWYMINNMNTMFFKKMYTEGLGGNNTLRGIDRNRIIGEGFTFANLEFRWRIAWFQFINQNWIIGLNPFFDAGMVTQKFRAKEIDKLINESDHAYVDELFTNTDESIHCAAGCGLKLIMNKNLVVSIDMGKALDPLDGKKLKTYVGFNYIF